MCVVITIFFFHFQHQPVHATVPGAMSALPQEHNVHNERVQWGARQSSHEYHRLLREYIIIYTTYYIDIIKSRSATAIVYIYTIYAVLYYVVYDVSAAGATVRSAAQEGMELRSLGAPAQDGEPMDGAVLRGQRDARRRGTVHRGIGQFTLIPHR